MKIRVRKKFQFRRHQETKKTCKTQKVLMEQILRGQYENSDIVGTSYYNIGTSLWRSLASDAIFASVFNLLSFQNTIDPKLYLTVS